MEEEILFRVIVGGHEYTIYTTGRIEGFGEGAIVVNYYPQLEKRLLANHRVRPEAHSPSVTQGQDIPCHPIEQ